MKGLFELIREMDVFAHNQFLRYRREDNYRTLTGGLVSIFIIAFFIGIFMSLLISTFNHSVINSNVTRSYEINPTSMEITVSPADKFVFAFGLLNTDMRSTTRFFDIVYQQNTYQNSAGINSSSIDAKIFPLTPCQKTDWTGITHQIQKEFDNLRLEQFLCIPKGSKLKFEGRWTSNLFTLSQVRVSKCTQNNTLYPGTVCATETQIKKHLKEYGDFSAAFYYINSILNLGQQNYISYYIQDRNVVFFNRERGAFSDLYFAEYSIKTDNSILPWAQVTQKNGIYVQSKTPYHQYYTVVKDEYFLFSMIKTDFKLNAGRSYQKLDENFSYIGGLYGTILSFMVFLNLYDKYSYEIEFGDRIFKQNNKKSYGSQHFNFIIFLGYGLFHILLKLGVNLKWNVMKKYHECRMECLKQLDINLLFKKIQFFEQISSVILEEHHFIGLQLIPKKSIKESQINRKKYLIQGLMYHQVDKKIRDISVQQQEYRKKYETVMSSENLPFALKQEVQMQRKQTNSQELATKALRNLQKLQDTYQKGDKISIQIMKMYKKNKQLEVLMDFVFNVVINKILKLQLNQETSDKHGTIEIISDYGDDQQVKTQSVIINRTGQWKLDT